MFSIIIPTLNNIEYLKFAIKSLKKNSRYKDHEIIIHVNIGDDGTLDYLIKNNYKYTYTKFNSGITKGVNLAAKEATREYIVYVHDDFYFCPDWDYYLFEEIKKIKDDKFYLSGTMINNGQVQYNCGNSLSEFNEAKLLSGIKKMKLNDFQGSTWAPTLISRKLWNRVGGFSEEFFAGSGSDPDFNMKLWKIGVRIFKGVGKSTVYHFGSIVSRKKKYTSVNWTGSKGGKIFLLKWGFSIKFFTNFYLRGCKTLNNTLICNNYDGPLNEPKKNIFYYSALLKDKIFYLYLKITNFK